MEYFEQGQEKIDYDATASVYLQNNPSGEWEVCVVKFFFDMSQKKRCISRKTTTISVSVTLRF